MGQIKLTDIRIYAYHGCLEEEKKIGSDYTVNLKVSSNLDVPAKSDDLKDAVDYVKLHQIVEEEMAVRQKDRNQSRRSMVKTLIELEAIGSQKPWSAFKAMVGRHRCTGW